MYFSESIIIVIAKKQLKRGVKEVVKSIRKGAKGYEFIIKISVVVMAADISPVDVLSHIPI
jgi:H/ACA ribonucleoprotein complex subunit 2